MNRRMLVIAILTVGCTSTPPDVATGDVGPWLAGPPLPTARANHCSAVIDDWVLVIGGNHMEASGFVKTDEIHAAQLAADGTLGPWHLAGRTPSPVSECNATSDGKTLYVIDGLYDVDTDRGQIYTATLDATGMLSPLTLMGALPAGIVAISSEAAVRDGSLLVMDTRVPDSGDQGATLTLRTPLSNMAWSTDNWNIGFRSQAEYAFSDTFAYTIGGYHDPAIGAVTDVFVAPIGAGGAIGTSTPTTALPMPIGWGEAAVVDQWLFVVGGRASAFGGGGTTAVLAAPIAADGSVGAWVAKTALPMPRTNHDVVVVGDYLVLTGGANTGPGDTAVLVAQVRYAPSVTQ